MEIFPNTTERGLSETPGPSENAEVKRRANPVAQDTQNVSNLILHPLLGTHVRVKVPQPYRFILPRGGGHSAADANLMQHTVQQQSSSHPPKITRLHTRTNQSWVNGLATYYGDNAI